MGIILLHDNVLAHMGKVAKTTINGCVCEILPYLMYLLDMEYSGYHLFPFLKKNLHKKHFQSYNLVKTVAYI